MATSLREILGLPEGGVISIVGAGGKTTLLFALAREIAAAGETVLTTTTTKILVPGPEESPQVIVSADLGEIRRKAADSLDISRHMTAGSALIAPENKLAGFTADDICKLELSGLFRWILVESDGARRRPLKAPAAHEPVIPSCAQAVIAVVGLDAPGRPLTEEWVFRSRLYGKITGLPPGARITERSVAAALTHAEGIMKGCPPGAARLVFLNKADTRERRETGRKIAGFLQEAAGGRPDRVIIASLREGAAPPGFYDLHTDRKRKKTAAPPAKVRTAGIILAAGMSKRMGNGEAPKQLLEAGGKPLLAWTLEAALHSELGEIILVLGHEAARIRAALGPLAAHPRLKIVINERYREGMASSLETGLREGQERLPSVMFLLGDQPLVGTETINLLLRRFREADKGIGVPVWGRRRGNPVIFSSRYYDEILAIRGDRGARDIIDAYPDDVLPVAVDDPRCFLDLDSAEDARQLLPLLKNKS